MDSSPTLYGFWMKLIEIYKSLLASIQKRMNPPPKKPQDKIFEIYLPEEHFYDHISQQIDESTEDQLESCRHWVDYYLERRLIRSEIAADLHRQIGRRTRKLALGQRTRRILPHLLKREETAKKMRELKEIKGPTKLV